MVAIKDMVNGSAGLLLLGSLFFNSGSALKAKGLEVKDLRQHASEYLNLLNQEVSYELKERRDSLSYFQEIQHLDKLLERKLGCSYDDVTLESQEIAQNFMTDVYKTAAKNALDKFELYIDTKKGLKKALEDAKDSILKDDIKLEYILEDSKDNKEERNYFGLKITDFGFDMPSLDKEGIKINAHAEFTNDEGTLIGKINVGNREAKAALLQTISNEIYLRFDGYLKHLNESEDLESYAGLSIGGGNKRMAWGIGVGHTNGPDGDNTCASASITAKF